MEEKIIKKTTYLLKALPQGLKVKVAEKANYSKRQLRMYSNGTVKSPLKYNFIFDTTKKVLEDQIKEIQNLLQIVEEIEKGK